MKTKHTPGPWDAGICADQYGERSILVSSPTNHVVDLKFAEYSNSRAETEANAQLIASAPDMLESLIRIVNLQDAGWDKAVLALKIRETAIKAIAKATGGAE